MPWVLPFQAFLLSPVEGVQQEIPFGSVSLQPFTFAPFQPFVDLKLEGRIQPPGDDPSPALELALSDLLSRYLAGKPTRFHAKPTSSPHLPSFLNAILNKFPSLPLELPGSPDPDLQLLQNVRIEDLTFDGTGPNGEILCSGQVLGELFLPEGLEGLNSILNITELWPDVLVFDGKPILTLEGGQEGKEGFPPTPLPPKAFARLKPEHWSTASTTLVNTTDPSNPSQQIQVAQVQMALEAVPFSVLPGRSDAFRSYLAKVLLGSGKGPGGKVETGVWGQTQIRTDLPGLGRLQLGNVLVQGVFFVGRTGL